MQILTNNIIFILLTFFVSAASAQNKHSLSEYYSKQVKDCVYLTKAIFFCGNEHHREQVLKLLNQVDLTKIGRSTLSAIDSSNNMVLIMHYDYAVSSAGKTLATLSSKLTNGQGEDAVIQMNFDAPMSGTHKVTNSKNQLIPFPLDVNFLHELSHARHYAGGTWWMTNSEEQAVTDENSYRKEIALLHGENSVQLRDLFFTDNDIKIWNP